MRFRRLAFAPDPHRDLLSARRPVCTTHDLMVPLVADRFLPIAQTLVRDLGTNGFARLRLERTGGDHAGWLDWCAALGALWHPLMAECLDAGGLGAGHRFEAYAVAAPVRRNMSDRQAQARARRSVSAFLRACGVAPGLVDADAVDASGRCLVVPGSFGSMPAAADAADPAGAWFGLRLVARPVLHALVERLGHHAPPGMSVIEVEAAAQSGGRLLLRQCAREARRLGWVPVAAESLIWNERRPAPERAALDDTLAARHVLVVHDARGPGLTRQRLARLVLRLGARSRLPRLLVMLVERRTDTGGLVLSPVSEADLLGAVVTTSAALRARAARAVRACRGRPGLLARALLGDAMSSEERRRTPRQGGGYRVHEPRAPYSAESPGATARTSMRPVSESALVDRTLTAVEALLTRGRGAAGARVLRREHGVLARRGRHAEAARLALASGRLLVQAGQSAAAARHFEEALRHLEGDEIPPAALQAAGWLGRCRLDALETEASECLLRSAWAVVHLQPAPDAAPWIAAQLARTLWWQGRFDEAGEITRTPPFAGPGGEAVSCDRPDAAGADGFYARVWWWAERARAALACGDQAGVTSALGAARSDAALSGESGRAEFLLARAWWEAATGDADALLRTVREGLLAARAAHDRVCALELRVIALDGLLRAGRRPAARRCAARLRRTRTAALPALLGARVQLALAMADAHPSGALQRARLVDRGIGACAPGAAGVLADWPTWSASRSRVMVEDVIDLVRACQEEEDARRALERVAAMLGSRLHAAGAMVLVGGRHPATIAGPSSGRLPLTTARRSMDGGLALEPQAVEGGLEAAAPVRYAGAVIGAIACRWLHDAGLDAVRVMALLSTAAASAAPCVESVGRTIEPPGLPQIETELLGTSDAMEQVRRAVARAADAPFPVLVSAESGCGKELVARALHRASARRARALSAINCAALPDDLLEAELFGHARGAFTGASLERRGLFEEADGGTLFLDEIGELSPRGQAKLLRVLQDGEVRRLGETMARRVDVRVVAATNRVLEREAEAGRFRRDLLYRLDVIRITVPPLRERIDDVPLLTAAFWRRATERVGSRAVLGDAVLAALARHDWPGNVRELQNVIAALAVNAPRRGSVGVQVLGDVWARVPTVSMPMTLDIARRQFETRFIRAALVRAGGHRGRAAAELGLSRQGLGKLMDRLGLAGDRPGAEAAPTAASS